jgi:beta-mannosidase
VEADVAPGRWDWRLNGRRIFPRGTNYIADFYLDQVTPEGLRRDLKCVRDAHLDMIRVHGHIGPPELYALCDELGILVLCDFPMQWTYAFDLPADQATAFRDQVIAQAERMVRVLGSHPSIACWFLHNEPPWTDAGAFLGGDVHDADTNHEVDLAASRRVAEIDSTRPALPASGQFDDHLYHGWYTGSWLDKQELSPAFPTEFGVQSLPNLESPFWSTVHSEWPVDGEDPSWVHAGYQPLFWVSPGVGPPSAYATLEDYIAASQAYQAFTLGFTIDQWRKGKFAPTGGYVQFLLADAWPAITWSVLDYYRLPKAGYRALAEASRPFALLVDPAPDFHIEGSHTIVYPDGAEIAFDLFAVNDDYATEGKATAAWWVEPEGPGLWAALSRRRARLFRRASSFVVPGADEGALRVGSHRVSPRQPGTYALHVQLVHRGQRIGQRTWRFRVGAPQEHIRHPRRVPGFLVRRVYVKNSLQHTQDGFTFALKNPAMPVEIDSLMRLAVDGAPVASRDADLVRGGTRRRLSTISPGAPLEVASGDRLNIVVHGRRLAPGKHEIGITAVIVGIGEVAAVVEDELH